MHAISQGMCRLLMLHDTGRIRAAQVSYREALRHAWAYLHALACHTCEVSAVNNVCVICALYTAGRIRAAEDSHREALRLFHTVFPALHEALDVAHERDILQHTGLDSRTAWQIAQVGLHLSTHDMMSCYGKHIMSTHDHTVAVQG